jgi:AcrR family transcriptional regulator
MTANPKRSSHHLLLSHGDPDHCDNRPMPASSLREQYSQATRSAVMRSARSLFARRGYAGVTLDEIGERARATKGAVYHHFKDKRALFAAVCEEVQAGVVEKVKAAASGCHDPWQQLVLGLDTFLDSCLERDVQQIVLIDGPAVLGWKVRHELDERYGVAIVREQLERLGAAGDLDSRLVGPLAPLLTGALLEASSVIAQAPDSRRAREEMGPALEWLFSGLRRDVRADQRAASGIRR